jgi:hypothetical protein
MYSPTLSQRDEAGVIPPPPGITPNFANPPSRAHAIIGIHIVCAILSTVFTMLRSYTVYFITRHVKIDDCEPSVIPQKTSPDYYRSVVGCMG